MFTEILKFIPRIDRAALGVMEHNLTKRFTRVATRFGKGLDKVLKGNILFLSMGLLTQLLNPLEKLEDRIKALLGQGSDLAELADKFNTTPATLKRLEAVAKAVGVSPERFQEMLGRYASAVETARTELEDPTKERSASTIAVQQFVDEPDMVQGFFKFLQSLQAQGKGPGKDEFFSDRERRRAAERDARGETLSDIERQRLIDEGLLKRRSGAEIREQTEQAVFGEKQFGAARRFIEADFVSEFMRFGWQLQRPQNAEEKLEQEINILQRIPAEQGANVLQRLPGHLRGENPDGLTVTRDFQNDPLERALDKADRLNQHLQARQTRNEMDDLIKTSEIVNPAMVNSIEAGAEREREETRRQLQSFEDLAKASKGIDELKALFFKVTELAVEGLGYLGEGVGYLRKLMDSRFFR